MESRISIVIVEDDIITQSQIRSYLKKAGYEVLAAVKSAEDGWELLKQGEVDLAILDINLAGEKEGLWLAEKLNQHGKVPFIFLTAHNDKETISEAVELRPQSYLIKPFDEIVLFSAIELAMRNFAKADEKSEENILIRDSLFVKENNLLVKIKLADMVYAMSDGNYVELYVNHRKYLIRQKLNDFQKILSPDDFLRVHQRYIVNLHKLETIGTGHVLLAGQEVPVSKAYRDELMRRVRTV